MSVGDHPYFWQWGSGTTIAEPVYTTTTNTKTVWFSMKEFDRESVLEFECEYCGCANRIEYTECTHCGAPRKAMQ